MGITKSVQVNDSTLFRDKILVHTLGSTTAILKRVEGTSRGSRLMELYDGDWDVVA